MWQANRSRLNGERMYGYLSEKQIEDVYQALGIASTEARARFASREEEATKELVFEVTTSSTSQPFRS